MWRNDNNAYGWVAIVLHWLMAVLLVGMVILGVWMVTLSYADPWYHRAPSVHRSLGVVFFLLLLLRLAWRFANQRPAFEAGVSRRERQLALLIQAAFYLLMLAIPVTGYLMSTARGRAVDVFGLFELPATWQLEGQVDMLGQMHETLAWLLVGLLVLHVAGALKHHFVDKDRTLLKMLTPHSRRTP